MFKKILLLATLLVLAASLFGCKTVQGVGEDIKSVGEAAEKAVD